MSKTKKYNIKFKLVVEGEMTVNGENEDDAMNRLLGRDAIDIVSEMNIYQSDLEDMKPEEVDY